MALLFNNLVTQNYIEPKNKIDSIELNSITIGQNIVLFFIF